MIANPRWLPRAWWAALAAIAVMAGVLRFTGYNFSLPYIDHPDEPNFYIQAALRFERGESIPHMQSYPPAYFTLYRAIQILLNDPDLTPVEQVALMRVFSILVNLLALTLIGLLAYCIAGEAAGLLAAGFWAVQPVVVEHSRFATPDNYAVLAVLAAMFSAVMALRTGRWVWTFAGTVSALLAFLFKYPAGAVLPVVILTPVLWVFFSPPGQRRSRGRRLWPVVALNIALSGLVVAWAFWDYGVLRNTARDLAQIGEPLHFPTWFHITGQMNGAMADYGALWALGAAGLVLALLWERTRSALDPSAMGVVAGGGALFLLGVASFGLLPYHNVYPLAAILTVLWGVGVSVYLALVDFALSRLFRMSSAEWTRVLPTALMLGLALLALAPAAIGAWADAQQRTLRDTRVDLMEWADASLPPGAYLSGDQDNHKTFNRAWGGYNGVNDFPIHRVALVTEQPVEIWREAGVQYAIVPYWIYAQMLDSPDGRAYLNDLLLLKTFPPSPDRRGPAMAVFRLTPIQHPLSVNFGGEIELIGYDLSTDHVRPGETVTVTHYWRALMVPSATYAVYNHMTPLDAREIVAQADGLPLSERRLTPTWGDSGEVLIGQPFRITLGEGVAPGVYRLLTGLYVREDGRRLPVVGGGEDTDYAVLALLTVTR